MTTASAALPEDDDPATARPHGGNKLHELELVNNFLELVNNFLELVNNGFPSTNFIHSFDVTL